MIKDTLIEIKNIAELPEEILAQRIFPFVGPKQYRSVGGVCTSFERSYRSMFPEKTTHYNISTMKLAKFCWDDAKTESEKEFLRQLANEQTWYYIVIFDKEEDWSLLQWAKSTFGCSWGGMFPAKELYSDPHTCSIAAKHGDLDVMKVLCKMGCKWDKDTCSNAAANGHLKLLKWAHRNGCPWNEDTCSKAAKFGHLEVLQWARTNGCPWNEDTCNAAAQEGHLQILQYARAYSCPWNEYTCKVAAANGHLSILKWAHENKCPWDEESCVAAALAGHKEIWEYARENKCPFTSMRMSYTSASGTRRLVPATFDDSVTWDEVCNWVSHIRALRIKCDNLRKNRYESR